VIDLRSLVLLTAFAALACNRPDDLPHKRDEVLAIARTYQGRFDELKQRADELDRRIRAIPAATLNSAAAQHTLALARTTVDQGRARLAQLPAMLEAWLQSGDSRNVQRLFDGLRHQLDDNAIEASSGIAAVESWTALADHHLEAPQAPAAPVPEPMPEPTTEDREPADGSGAPIR
jgi:hypothetical protein